MAIRSLAISGLALAAALAVAQPVRAQSFFSFYEMSPRQIVGMLEDDGYDLRGPMLRRGDVYICDVVLVSGQPSRLIVSARDGHVLQRYAERGARSRDYGESEIPRTRPSHALGDDDRDYGWDDREGSRHQLALGDLFNPPSRVYGGEGLFSPKSDGEDAPAAKPKHHAMKKHPGVAKAPATAPTPGCGERQAGPNPVTLGRRRRAVRIAGAEEAGCGQDRRPEDRRRQARCPARRRRDAGTRAEEGRNPRAGAGFGQQPEARSAAQEDQRPPRRHARLRSQQAPPAAPSG